MHVAPQKRTCEPARRTFTVCSEARDSIRLSSMYRFRSSSNHLRRWIAVTATYALLLQSLLIAVITSQSAAAQAAFSTVDEFVVCSSRTDRSAADSQQPLRHPIHDSGCVFCLSAAGAPAILLEAGSPPLALPTNRLPQASWHAGAIATVRHTPRQSQGPPTIA